MKNMVSILNEGEKTISHDSGSRLVKLITGQYFVK